MKTESDSRAAVSRRQFIGGAAAASAFAIVQSGAVKAYAANSRIECGVIGNGSRGRMIANMVKEHGGYEITALADYFPEVAERVGEEMGVPKKRCFSGLSGYEKLLKSKVDAVFLETPPYCFPDHTTAAVDAGCHVYMAKPLASDVPGCLMVDAAGKKATQSKKVFLVDFQTRTEPLYIEAIKRAHAGELGDIALLSTIYADDAFNDPPLTETIESRLQHLTWVNDSAIGGGYFVNAGIHSIDVALWLANAKPVSAVGASRAARRDPHGDSHDIYSITYHFENGLLLNHRGEHLKNRHGFDSTCVAHCLDGFLETGYSTKVRMVGKEQGEFGGEVKALYQQGAIRNIDTFHKNVTNGVYDNPTIEPSVTATLATILGREACRKGQLLTWDDMIKQNERLEVNLSGLKA
ncbi:MAG: Gfo/Idh/MocA family oxidoreductase [Candidatus Hydrogenedentes bacterium]|nr:Gfo/Idh/MocA family oxidoreductase [Candidatus Hydrogenedentota bacterium]